MSSDRSSKNSGWTTFALLAAGMVIFGSGTPVSKLVTDEFPVFVGSGPRMAFAALLLLPFVAFREADRPSNLTTKDYAVLIGVAVIGMFLFSILMLYGMKEVSGVVGSIVMSVTPAVTAIASFIFLHERLGWRKAGAVALAVLGVLVVNLGGGVDASEGSNLLLGSLLVFGAVCGEAGYTLLGKVATDRLTPIAIAGISAGIATVLFLPFAIWQWQSFAPGDVSLKGWLALAWWGAGTMALGSVIWYWGVAKVAASTSAGFMGVMPVSALVLSYLLLGEPFRWIHMLGFAIVFAGVGLISWAHARMGAEMDH